MLKRIRSYAQANPLPWWVVSVTILLAFELTSTHAFPGRHGPGTSLIPICFAVGTPTLVLLRRFEGRHEMPVPSWQVWGTGLLSLTLSLGSIGAFGLGIAGARLGWSPDHSLVAFFLFSPLAVLSLPLGYAARDTWAGLWALRVTGGWLSLIVCFAAAVSLWRAAGHG
jgi:hypothetical protein